MTGTKPILLLVLLVLGCVVLSDLSDFLLMKCMPNCALYYSALRM